MSTAKARYQVRHYEHGIIEVFDTKKEAFKFAAFKAMAQKDTYEVFDLAAKKNSIEVWIFRRDGTYTEKIRE